jgi:hypothetical protein
MKSTIIAAVLLLASGAAIAEEPAKKTTDTLQQMDNHAACYYANVAYSKGSFIKAGDVQLKCVRTMINGNRREENPLEWEKL